MIEQLQAVGERVRRADQERSAAAEERRKAIRAAQARGMTYKAIGDALRIEYHGIPKMLKGK